MPPNNDMLVWMNFPNQATTEAKSAQGQGILSIDNFAKMYKEGAELVNCQLSRHEGVFAAGRIKSNVLIGGPNPRFCLMMDAIKQWEQCHREVDSNLLGYIVREGIILF